MLDMEKLERLALEAGFTHAGPLARKTIRLRPEVRSMCSADACHTYGKKWTCPPGCGTLEQCQERLDRYEQGILVQTVGKLEDSFDYEGMMDIESQHKAHFSALEKVLREKYPDMLAVAAGACTKCKTCTYPDAPCRFPKEAFASMEAYGMLVVQVCKANGMAYYYGPDTIAYTSCFLLE